MIMVLSIKIIPEISPTTEIAPIILSQAPPIRSDQFQPQSQSHSQEAQEFMIKKVILEKELQDPEIEVGLSTGDYVVVKTTNEISSNQSSINTRVNMTNHLYIKGQQNLEYVCNITSGLPNFFGSCLVPGKQIPTYESRKEASKMLKTLGPDKFYQSDHWSSTRQKEDEIYLYLDPRGYVRWIRR